MNTSKKASNTVHFAKALANSAAFDKLYREGMDLVEETAAYLDGEGRTQSDGFAENLYQFYSQHALQLTSQLMHLASWLLLHRAKRDKEMSAHEVFAERKNIQINLNEWQLDNPFWEEVPTDFLSLVLRTKKLQTRLTNLDHDIYHSQPTAPVSNAVAVQLQLLSTALEQSN